MSEELSLRVANMQDVIVTIIEKISPSYVDDDWFVPQSVILEKLMENSQSRVQTERYFLSAIAGRKNSISLFESVTDPETGELKLRLRNRSGDITPARLERRRATPEEQARQIEHLQRTVRELRAQVATLDAENQRSAAIIEGLRQRQKPEVQKMYETYETLYGILEQLDSSLTAVNRDVSAIAAKIPKI